MKIIEEKTCTECIESKPLNEFYKEKNGKYGVRSKCKKCLNQKHKKYQEKRKEELSEYNKNYYEKTGRRKQGSKSMYENKLCTQYLGIVIGERLCRHLFKDVEVMPYGHTGFDIVCRKGFKIDVKSACMTFTDKNKRNQTWTFFIDYNTIPDFFILVAFDNRKDLNPLHLWMIPGHEINKNGSKSIRPSTVHKWSQWERDIKDAQLCCDTMKKNEIP